MYVDTCWNWWRWKIVWSWANLGTNPWVWKEEWTKYCFAPFFAGKRVLWFAIGGKNWQILHTYISTFYACQQVLLACSVKATAVSLAPSLSHWLGVNPYQSESKTKQEMFKSRSILFLFFPQKIVLSGWKRRDHEVMCVSSRRRWRNPLPHCMADRNYPRPFKVAQPDARNFLQHWYFVLTIGDEAGCDTDGCLGKQRNFLRLAFTGAFVFFFVLFFFFFFSFVHQVWLWSKMFAVWFVLFVRYHSVVEMHVVGTSGPECLFQLSTSPLLGMISEMFVNAPASFPGLFWTQRNQNVFLQPTPASWVHFPEKKKKKKNICRARWWMAFNFLHSAVPVSSVCQI